MENQIKGKSLKDGNSKTVLVFLSLIFLPCCINIKNENNSLWKQKRVHFHDKRRQSF